MQLGSKTELRSILSPQLVWLSWLEYCPTNQKVVSSIPRQGTCLGHMFGLLSAPVQEAIDGCFSRFLSPPPPAPNPYFPVSLKSIRMSLGEDLKKRRKVVCSLVNYASTWVVTASFGSSIPANKCRKMTKLQKSPICNPQEILDLGKK